MTRLVEKVDANGKGTGQFDVMVDFPDKDATTGQSVMTSKTPTEAVKRMTEIPEFQNLFRKNVVSGVGGNSAIGGLTPGSNGRIDVRNLTHDQYPRCEQRTLNCSVCVPIDAVKKSGADCFFNNESVPLETTR